MGRRKRENAGVLSREGEREGRRGGLRKQQDSYGERGEAHAPQGRQGRCGGYELPAVPSSCFHLPLRKRK